MPPLASAPIVMGAAELGAAWNGFVYDNVVPDGVKHLADEGLRSVGHGLSSAAHKLGGLL